jgi:hypothetical protein
MIDPRGVGTETGRSGKIVHSQATIVDDSRERSEKKRIIYRGRKKGTFLPVSDL